MEFNCDNSGLKTKWQAAVAGLRRNVVRVFGYEAPVLIEGGGYPGIWLECGPMEGAIYGLFDPVVARDNHRIFFRLQREDGYFPCWIWADRSGQGQIQMVVPIAATAWEVYQQTGDEDFLCEAYEACQRWDEWLVKYRDTLGSGLCEAFCEYDTGHDNSPRFFGLPHEGLDGDARGCSKDGQLPYIAPDLSATVYGGRRALAVMAHRLGRPAEAKIWESKAETTRRKLIAVCYDTATKCFYDRNRSGELVRIRGDALTRVLCERVVENELFEEIYRCQIRDPQGFWTPYPLPSIAASDPAFVKEIPHNSWGGAAQALTALRAPRWFGYYGKPSDLTIMMRQWVRALVADDGFRQQLNPWTGQFTPGPASYSPAMLVLVDFLRRLCGPVVQASVIEWNCLSLPGARSSSFSAGQAEIRSECGHHELRLDGRLIGEVHGECSVVTELEGTVVAVVGSAPEVQQVRLSQGTQVVFSGQVRPDESLAL